MNAGLRSTTKPLAEEFELALVDLDGVTYKGPNPVVYAPESLAAARASGMRLVFVTNNASREPGSVAQQLTGLDIPAKAADVMTSAQAAAALLAERISPGDRVLVVGGAGLYTAVREQGFEIVDTADERPVAVVQGFDPTVSWARLAEASYAIEAGAWHVASNRDLSIPTAGGVAPGNGTLVNAVVAATGVEPDSAGKPSPTMYRLAVDRCGASSALVIGDRLDTDLAGARAGGYRGLHVLTGVSTARDAVLAPAELRPDFIGLDLRCLLEPHTAPVAEADGWWSCGDAAARVVDGSLQLADTPVTIDAVRACAAAVWNAVDKGERVAEDSIPELSPQTA